MTNIFETILKALLDKLRELGSPTMSDVDLAAKLDEMAEGTGMEWRTSVVDLLELLDVDNSLEDRRDLAAELNVAGKIGTPEGNEELRLALFRKIADNGGNLPDSLLD